MPHMEVVVDVGIAVVDFFFTRHTPNTINRFLVKAVPHQIRPKREHRIWALRFFPLISLDFLFCFFHQIFKSDWAKTKIWKYSTNEFHFSAEMHSPSTEKNRFFFGKSLKQSKETHKKDINRSLLNCLHNLIISTWAAYTHTAHKIRDRARKREMKKRNRVWEKESEKFETCEQQ